MNSKKAGLTSILAALPLICAPTSLFAQTLSDYTPPPMFGATANKPTFARDIKEEKTTVKKTVAQNPHIKAKPQPRPIIKITEKTPIPAAKPNIPAKIVASEAGPAMPASPKVVIHKSSILVEDPSFHTGDAMTRNLDAFEDNYTPQKTQASDTKEIKTAELIEPTAEELYEKLNGFDGQELQETKEIKPQKTSLLFSANDMELKKSHIEKLAQQVLQRFVLLDEEHGKSTRIQVVAYAQTNEEPRAGISGAKRLSLARALSVQGWLIDNGIASSQIDVKAKGDETDTTPIDRVDLYIVTPQN